MRRNTKLRNLKDVVVKASPSFVQYAVINSPGIEDLHCVVNKEPNKLSNNK